MSNSEPRASASGHDRGTRPHFVRCPLCPGHPPLNEIKDALLSAKGAEKAKLQKAKKLLEQAERLVDTVRNK